MCNRISMYQNTVSLLKHEIVLFYLLSVAEKSIISVFCWVTEQMPFAHTWFLRLLQISVIKVHY